MRGEGVADGASVDVGSEEEAIASEELLSFVTGSVCAIVASVSSMVDKRPGRLPAGKGSALSGGYVSPGDGVGALSGGSCGAMVDVVRWWLVRVQGVLVEMSKVEARGTQQRACE